MPNISKFNFSEIFSNDNGKTSGSGFAGVIICLVCAICFVAGVVDKMFLSHTSDVMDKCISFVMWGAGLLGVRKFMQNKIAPEEEKPQEEKPVEKPKEEAKGTANVDNPDA